MQYVSGLVEKFGVISREPTGFVASGCQFSYDVEVRDTDDKSICKIVPVQSLKYSTNFCYRSPQDEPTYINKQGTLGVVFSVDAGSGCVAILPHTYETACLHEHIDVETCRNATAQGRFSRYPDEQWNYWSDAKHSIFKVRKNLDFFGVVFDNWGEACGVRGNAVSVKDEVSIKLCRMYDLLLYLCKELGDGILTCKTLGLQCGVSGFTTLVSWHGDAKADLFRTKMMFAK